MDILLRVNQLTAIVSNSISLRRQRLIKFPDHYYCKSVKNYVVEWFSCRSSSISIETLPRAPSSTPIYIVSPTLNG